MSFSVSYSLFPQHVQCVIVMHGRLLYQSDFPNEHHASNRSCNSHNCFSRCDPHLRGAIAKCRRKAREACERKRRRRNDGRLAADCRAELERGTSTTRRECEVRLQHSKQKALRRGACDMRTKGLSRMKLPATGGCSRHAWRRWRRTPGRRPPGTLRFPHSEKRAPRGNRRACLSPWWRC